MTSSEIETKGPQILDLIKSSKKILLHFHPRPDGDSIGGALAMKHVLTEMGKEVTVIKGDSPIPGYLSHLPGIADVVLKNILEIDLTAFDLFLIQDSGSIGHVSNLAEVVFPATLKTVCIDHHISNEGYGQLNLIDADFPAVCDLLVSLFTSWGVVIPRDAAVCLMTGIVTDTGGFRYRGVSARTFKNASILAEAAPDFAKVLFLMDNSNTKEKFVYVGLAFSSIKTYLDGTVAISAVSYADLQSKGVSREDAKGGEVSNLLKSVIGWEIGISAIEEAPGEVKISMRTRDAEKYDLSTVALALGGGGHKGAAGIFLKTSLDDAVQKLVEVITKLYGAKLN